MATFNTDTYVWVTDEYQSYLPAQVMSTFTAGSPGTVKLVINNRAMKLTKEESSKLIPMDAQSLENIDDMVNLKQLDEPSILHNLRMRFANDQIYTYIGDILISVNPFKKLPIYSPEVIDSFAKNGNRGQMPHIFGVADKAYSSLVNNRKNQSCIVSGESGAGKTEATKLFLNYLAEKSSSGDSKTKENSTALQQRILEANPLMEAFGNAKTVRNDNSSRFGKLIQVQLDNQKGQIVGGSIIQYLLEKSRLVSQAEGERNYHIFYQLCEAASVNSAMKKKLKLDFASEYFYLNQSSDGQSMIVESINDLSEWENTLQAMNVIDISQGDRDSVTEMLAGILHLGNVEFEADGDASKVSTPEFVENASALFQVDAAALGSALIKRKLRESYKLHSVEQAIDARDAFAKAVYGRMFEWLIEQINLSLAQNTVKGDKLSSISVLDIFGFESFAVNSYEQLCINYCNEKLQGHFNEHIFRLEQELYKKEGINLDQIMFADNSFVLQLLEGKGGVFSLIDEQNKLPKGSDEGFLTKVKELTGDKAKNEIISLPDVKELRKKENQVIFKVKHYAGIVPYTVTSFLEKNKDDLLEDLYQIGLKSKSKFLAGLFKRSKGAKENKKTIGSQFREQLHTLMETLGATEPHYVRTIKPNAEKEGDIFTAPMVLDQMKYSGLMEVCRIRKLGYPIRKDFKEFVHLYMPLSQAKKGLSHADLCADLEEQKILIKGEYQIGKTKIFLRTEQSNSLEAKREVAIREKAAKLQAVARRFIARRRYGKFKGVLADINAAIKKRDANAIELALQKTGILPFSGQHLPVIQEAKKLLARIQEENKVVAMLQHAMESRDLNSINSAIKAAGELKMSAKVLDDAKKLVTLIEKERSTIVDLEAAVKAKDVAKIKSLLKTAEQLKLMDRSVTMDAVALVKHDEEEKAVIAALEKANKSKDIKGIKENLTKMANLGNLDHPAVKKGQEIAKAIAKASEEKEKEKEDVEKQLKNAVEAKDLGKLKDLKIKVIELGIAGALVTEANDLVKTLQEKEESLSVLSSEMQTMEIKAKSYDGITKEDIAKLKAMLDDVKKQGFKDSDEELAEALAFEKQMQDQLKAQEQVKQALKSGEKQKLLDALALIQSLGLETGDAKEVQLEIRSIEEREAESRAAKAEENKMKIRNEIKEGSPEEMVEEKKKLMAKRTADHARLVEMASDSAKYHFSKFYRVREDNDFLEYVPEELKAGVIEEKFKAQRRIVPKSMLAMNGNLNRVGLQIHKAILCYSGDLSHPFPNTMASYLITTGLENPDAVDEIYFHLCKHTTNNLRPVSEDRAWGLICIMTTAFPPSKEFAPYLINHLVRNRNRPLLIGNYARLCIVQLDGRIRLGHTKLLPSAEIIDGYSQRPPILAELRQPGNKQTLQIPVSPHEDVDHVMEIACEQAKIKEKDQFLYGCYVIDGKPKINLTLKERLTYFYRKWNRSKLQHIEYFVSQWEGNEEALFLRLEEKYGPEPTPMEIARMNNEGEGKSLLSAPVSAVKKAAKRLGLVNQNQTMPSPDSPWPLPWWVFLGDVYLRMIKQGRVPIFTFKRKLYIKNEKVTEELVAQAADEFTEGTVALKSEDDVISIAAMKIMLFCENNPPKTEDDLIEGPFKVTNVLPARWLTYKSPLEYAPLVLAKLGTVPKSKDKLVSELWKQLTKSPAFGKVFFYLTATDSDEVLSAGVDPSGIHTFNEDRTEVTFTYEYKWIKEFGASSAYFWMKYVPKTGGKGNAAYGKDGETIYLNTFQAWDLYSLVYDYTYNAKDLNLI